MAMVMDIVISIEAVMHMINVMAMGMDIFIRIKL